MSDSFLRKGGSASAAVAGTTLFGFLNNILLAHMLSMEELGVFFLLFNFIGWLVVFSNVGLDKVVFPLVAKEKTKGNRNSLIKGIQKIIFVVALTAMLVSMLVVMLSSSLSLFIKDIDHQIDTLKVALVWMFFLAMQRIIAETLRALGEVMWASLFQGSSTYIFIFIAYLSMFTIEIDVNVYYVMMAASICTFLSLSMAFFILIKKLKLMEFEEKSSNFHGFTALIKASSILLGTNILTMVIVQSDLWLVAYFFSEVDVAIYGAASRIALFISLPLVVVNSIVPPIIARMHVDNNYLDLEKEIRGYTSLASIVSVAGLMVYLIFSEELLFVTFGNTFTIGASVMLILAIGSFANVLAGPNLLVLMLTGNHISASLIAIFSGSLGVIASVLLGKEFNIDGIAYGMMIGILIQNITGFFWVKRTLDINTFTYFRVHSVIEFVRGKILEKVL